MQIGTVTLEPVLETERQSFPHTFFFEIFDEARVAEHAHWLVPDHYDPASKAVLISHHAWLVTTRTHKILIDPCVGNHKPRQVIEAYNMLDTPWLERLEVAGARPEDIDFVLCTHLHADHCGWNTRLLDGRWVPTFPNARYVFSAQERDYWGREAAGLPLEPSNRFNSGVYADSVLPVIEAGQALIVDSGIELANALTVIETRGHTPGHLSAVLDAGDDGIVFAGDAIHHPLQVVQADWNTSGCHNPAEARASRRSLLELCADRGLLLAPAHFRGPKVCRITRKGRDRFDIHWGP
jgi:glyoxylase-like metal-dependent hydrolase (beta-lactamase superfamily II)